MKILQTILVLIICVTAGCNDDKEWNNGAWKQEAKDSWNIYHNNLAGMGIQLRKPSRLFTEYITSEGTLGGGSDRFPYVNRDGNRLGGWLVGSCNNAARATVAREPNGYSSIHIKAHETAHHANNHALCDNSNGGHPDYMRQAGAPHWPHYRRGDSFIQWIHYTFEDDRSVCLMVVDDKPSARGVSELKNDLIDVAKGIVDEYNEYAKKYDL